MHHHLPYKGSHPKGMQARLGTVMDDDHYDIRESGAHSTYELRDLKKPGIASEKQVNSEIDRQISVHQHARRDVKVVSESCLRRCTSVSFSGGSGPSHSTNCSKPNRTSSEPTLTLKGIRFPLELSGPACFASKLALDPGMIL